MGTVGTQYLDAGYYDNWVLGPTYSDNKRTWTSGSSTPYDREKSLLGDTVSGLENPSYFERKKNQYKDKSIGDFVQLKSLGAKGTTWCDPPA